MTDTLARAMAAAALQKGGGGGGQGTPGVGVSGSTVSYASSTSGTTPPTTGWAATIPSVEPNNFLWTKVVITYTDGNSTPFYSVALMGATGAPGKEGAPGKDGDPGQPGAPGKDGADAPTITEVVETSVSQTDNGYTATNLGLKMSDGNTIPFTVLAKNGANGSGASTSSCKLITVSVASITQDPDTEKWKVSVADDAIAAGSYVKIYPADNSTALFLADRAVPELPNVSAGSFVFDLTTAPESELKLLYEIAKISNDDAALAGILILGATPYPVGTAALLVDTENKEE